MELLYIPDTPIAPFQQVSLNAATPSQIASPPSQTRLTLIVVEGASIRYLDTVIAFGQTVTSSFGTPLDPGAVIKYQGNPANLYFISQSGTAKINVNFY